MRQYKLKSILCGSIAALMFMGCNHDDSNLNHFDNNLFISASSFTNELRVKEDATEMSRDITVAIARPESFDINVVFRAAPELLDTYRAAYYDAEAELLPEKHYDLSDANTVISAGKVTSDPLALDFVELDKLDLEGHYVLPVTVASVNGVKVLESAKTLYFVFRESSLVNVVADMNQNWGWPDWEEFDEVEDMSTLTFEALIMGAAFKNESSVATIMGIEDRFLLRVGDVTTSKNQLEIAYAVKDEDGDDERGKVTDTSLRLQTGRWYHVAATFDNGVIKLYLDGNEKASGDASEFATTINFKEPHSDESDNQPRCFWVGYSYDDKRFLNGMMSEVRVWNKALTVEEIREANHFYQVEPDADGLIAYWKFDEEDEARAKADPDYKGIKDHSIYGNDLTLNSNPKWVAVALPEKEN